MVSVCFFCGSVLSDGHDGKCPAPCGRPLTYEGLAASCLVDRRGHTSVFRGSHRSVPVPVAIKTVTGVPGDCGAEWDERLALGDEIEILRRLAPAGARVPKLVGVVDTPEFFGVVQEWIEGVPLLDAAARMSDAEVLVTVRGIVELVASVHDARFMILDLKPESFVIRWHDGVPRPYLVDLRGAAPAGSSSVWREPSATTVTGDRHVFRAPEIYEGRVTRSCDVYSIGAMVRLMLALRPVERPVARELSKLAAAMSEPDPDRRVQTCAAALERIDTIPSKVASRAAADFPIFPRRIETPRPAVALILAVIATCLVAGIMLSDAIRPSAPNVPDIGPSRSGFDTSRPAFA